MNLDAFPYTRKTRNLVRFGWHPPHETLDESFVADFSFRAKQSRFSILKSPRTAPGPDQCFSFQQVDCRPLFQKLLGLELRYPELNVSQAASLQLYNSMNYYRSHIEEFFFHNRSRPLPPIEGTCTMFFSETNVLLICYRFRNASQAAVRVRARWHSIPDRGLRRSQQQFPSGFRYACTQHVLRAYEASAVVTASVKGLRFRWSNGRFWSDWIEHEIRPAATIEFTFRVAFALAKRTKARKPPPSRLDALLRAAVSETERLYARQPPISKRFERFESLVLKAQGMLHTLRVRDVDARGRTVSTLHSGKCGGSVTGWWDMGFTLLGLGLSGDFESGWGAVRLLLDGVKSDGTPPCYYHGGTYLYLYQQPILAWGVCHLFSFDRNVKQLKACYEPLRRYVLHWLTRHDANHNGLVEYPAVGVCWDDALRWQNRFPIAFAKDESWARKDWAEMKTEQFENVDTNSHLYLECLSLAEIARWIGATSEIAKWRERASTLRTKIHQHLFNKAAGIYQDRSIADGRFTQMNTTASFMPLYAGITPRLVGRKMLRRYLLNPTHFLTTMPFPSLDRSHPAFRSGGFVSRGDPLPGGGVSLLQNSYWIGRVWPHINYWLVAALYRYGLGTEADEAAGRILDAMNRSETINECYDPLTGCGVGHPEVNWCGAAVLALAHRHYIHGPLPTFHSSN